MKANKMPLLGRKKKSNWSERLHHLYLQKDTKDVTTMTIDEAYHTSLVPPALVQEYNQPFISQKNKKNLDSGISPEFLANSYENSSFLPLVRTRNHDL